MKSLLFVVILVQLGCTQLSVPSYYDAAVTRTGQGIAVLPDGSLYEGSFKNGLFQGQGKLTSANDSVYIGLFSNGLFHGQGRYTVSDGTFYEGEFTEGALHGDGLVEFANGNRYEGAFVKDQMSGQGVYSEREGARYSGTFENDSTVGRGRIEYSNDDRYEGEWLNWSPAGEGVMTNSSGTTYAGRFDDAQPTGEFLVNYSSGASYQGQMSAWSYSGTGRYTDSSGTIYTGDFDDDTFSGTGEISYKDGSKYAGEVARWEPHGAGQLTRSDGDLYVGEFRRGRYSGQGSLTRADGSVFEGAFKSGRFSGQGTLTWQSASGSQVLSGPWRRGLYVGLDRQDYVAEGIAAADIEQLLFDQQPKLDAALDQIEINRSGEVDMYLLTFAGHGEQKVFRSEAEAAREQLQSRFDIEGRALSLVNHPATTESEPLATATNLRYALAALGKKMDVENDVLFLFLTSHGSSDHALSVNLPGAPMQSLSADTLAQLLDEAGIVWRVIVVSACYSGGFIGSLQNDQSLVITSSRADRTSFGCSDDAEMTYFGRAFFDQALPAAPDLTSAFFTARNLVTERELAESFEPSEPQIHIGAQMVSKLQRSIEMKPSSTIKNK